MGKGSGSCDGRGAIALPALHVPKLQIYDISRGHRLFTTLDDKLQYINQWDGWRIIWHATPAERQRCVAEKLITVDMKDFGATIEFSKMYPNRADARRNIEAFFTEHNFPIPTQKYRRGTSTYKVAQIMHMEIDHGPQGWNIHFDDDDIIRALDRFAADANSLSHYHLETTLSHEECDAIATEFYDGIATQYFPTRAAALATLQQWIEYQLSK